MACWKIRARYYFGQLVGEFYVCAETVDVVWTGDTSYYDSVFLKINGIVYSGGYGAYFGRNEDLNFSQYTPTPEEIAEGKCSACPCPPNHCSIKCDRAVNGYCCISHGFINGLLGQLR